MGFCLDAVIPMGCGIEPPPLEHENFAAPPRIVCVCSAGFNFSGVGGFLLPKNMRRGQTTAAELAPLMFSLITKTNKRQRSKALTPLIDPVVQDYTQITKGEATRRFAELRKTIAQINQK